MDLIRFGVIVLKFCIIFANRFYKVIFIDANKKELTIIQTR